MLINIPPQILGLNHFASLFNSIVLIGILIGIELFKAEAPHKKQLDIKVFYPISWILLLLLIYFQLSKFINL